jgi:hypothetical protein
MRQTVARYMVSGEGVFGPKKFPGETYAGHGDDIVEVGLELLFVIGVDDYETLRKIFKPLGRAARQRAKKLFDGMVARLEDWVAYQPGGDTPGAGAFRADLQAFREVMRAP